eukprot:330631-Pleurochrysis_carterae.AAC.1
MYNMVVAEQRLNNGQLARFDDKAVAETWVTCTVFIDDLIGYHVLVFLDFETIWDTSHTVAPQQSRGPQPLLSPATTATTTTADHLYLSQNTGIWQHLLGTQHQTTMAMSDSKYAVAKKLNNKGRAKFLEFKGNLMDILHFQKHKLHTVLCYDKLHPAVRHQHTKELTDKKVAAAEMDAGMKEFTEPCNEDAFAILMANNADTTGEAPAPPQLRLQSAWRLDRRSRPGQTVCTASRTYPSLVSQARGAGIKTQHHQK